MSPSLAHGHDNYPAPFVGDSTAQAGCIPYGSFLLDFLATAGLIGTGFMESICRKRSSNPTPLPSAGFSSLGEFCGGLGFDGFPGFVALNLGSVGQALASAGVSPRKRNGTNG